MEIGYHTIMIHKSYNGCKVNNTMKWKRRDITAWTVREVVMVLLLRRTQSEVERRLDKDWQRRLLIAAATSHTSLKKMLQVGACFYRPSPGHILRLLNS